MESNVFSVVNLDIVNLDSSEIFLSVILFYSILCAVFEALVQLFDGCGNNLEMSAHSVQNMQLPPECNRIN